MKRLWLVMALVVGLAVGAASQTELTPIANLMGRTDGNGYLLVTSATSSGQETPLTPIGSLRGRTDSNGYLLVAGAGVTWPLTAPTGATAVLRTGTTAADTLTLSAYDVDGAAYTNMLQLTANNSPDIKALVGFFAEAGIRGMGSTPSWDFSYYSAAVIGLKSTMLVSWSNGTGSNGTKDVGLARDGAGVLRVTDGSTGVGSVKADTYYTGATAGCTGTPTVATKGIATTCTEPVPDPLTQAEVNELRGLLSQMRGTR